MLVTINVVEVSAELAHQATLEEVKALSMYHPKWEVYKEEDMYEGENYREDVQDVFNRYVDFYTEFLTNKAL